MQQIPFVPAETRALLQRRRDAICRSGRFHRGFPRDNFYGGVGVTVGVGESWQATFIYSASAANQDNSSQNLYLGVGYKFQQVSKTGHGQGKIKKDIFAPVTPARNAFGAVVASADH